MSRAVKATLFLGLTGSLLVFAPAISAKPPELAPNRIEISYVPPANPAHQHIYELLQERRILERFKAYFGLLRLPRTLLLKFDGCDGESNAWYEESEQAVTVCYEYIDEVLRNAPDMTTAAGVTPQDAIVGPTIEVFLHEIGHALFNQLHVPILGSEEDAADQVAAYLMLRMDKDNARHAVSGVVFMYRNEALAQDPKLRHFADVHGLPAQRLYNILCLAYGSDLVLFADVVEKGYLPESRAEGCADEYKQVDYAFKKLIYPYVDEAVRKKVQPHKLLKPAAPN